ncbi:MAG: proprotein convertase P-domain-containing protein [Planctomycetes bacterium]|nr:proprotein convertase P-domain-containing protein [Planctomycetota bacterium]
MAKRQDTYTYRAGRKLKLKKRPDQFVVRRLPGDLATAGMPPAKQMSSQSARVRCAPRDLEKLMSRARKMAPTHHAYEETESGNEFLITDRVFITFREPPDPEALGRFAGRYGLEILEKYSDRDYLLRLTDATGMNPVKLVVQLMEKEKKLVANAEHDLNIRARMALAPPSDSRYLQQWHLHTRLAPASDYDPRSSSRCEDAWLFLGNFGISDVVVGVTDDGCRMDHPDFDSPGKFAGWAYYQGTTLYTHQSPGADRSRMYQTGANHGTSCAGVIAAETDGAMTVGAAPGCRLLPVKWESSGPSLFISDSKLLNVLNFVADKVDVLSNSWGGSPVTRWSSIVVDRIAQLARAGGRRGRGIVFLWAAGNENCPISHTASIDVPYTDGWELRNGRWVWVGVETARVFANNLVGVAGVLHVAALASTAKRSHYSNYGTGIDICAPSSNSHAYWRMALLGRGIVTTTGSDWVTEDFGGTSSATPLVAGIAALAISANPALSAQEVVTILKQTASKDVNLTGYPRTPPASYDPDTSWDVSPISPFNRGDFQDVAAPEGTWSPWFGHGRADAPAAVRRARELAGAGTRQIQAETAPNLAIPDNDPAGVVSRLFIGDSGRINTIKVSVDIRHTYIGDLVVRLTAPDGRRVDLHRRSGGRTRDLVRTYDASTTPGLAQLQGMNVRGPWVLEVFDLAAIDQGTLNRWSIEADVTADDAIRVESAPGLSVPDDDPAGVQDSIAISSARAIAELAVEVDITHSWIGDLRVELIGPNGTRALLHGRSGGSADNIERTYTAGDVPALGSFVGSPSQGEWTLKVSDHAGQDVGKFNRWALVMR